MDGEIKEHKFAVDSEIKEVVKGEGEKYNIESKAPYYPTKETDQKRHKRIKSKKTPNHRKKKRKRNRVGTEFKIIESSRKREGSNGFMTRLLVWSL